MEIDVELVNLRVRLFGLSPPFALPEWSSNKKQQPAENIIAGFDKPVSVYQRELLQTGESILAPAIIVEVTSTTWVDEGWTVTTDKYGNLMLIK